MQNAVQAIVRRNHSRIEMDAGDQRFICEVCQRRLPPHTKLVCVWVGKGLILEAGPPEDRARELRYHWRACPKCAPQLDTAYALAALEDL